MSKQIIKELLSQRAKIDEELRKYGIWFDSQGQAMLGEPHTTEIQISNEPIPPMVEANEILIRMGLHPVCELQ